MAFAAPTQQQVDRWYRETVGRLELEAHERPGSYRLKVLALALIGYGYLYGLLGLSAFFIYRPLAAWIDGDPFRGWQPIMLIAGLTLLLSLLRALRTKAAPYDGFPITAREAPALFKLVEKVRRRLNAPPVHRIFLTTEMNAGVAQRPRLGLFGWHENVLFLGLPYLLTTDVKGLAGTLAHEFAHLSGGHGKVSAWIYRVRASWSRVVSEAEGRQGGVDLMTGVFFAFFAPYFAAYTFVLARQQEYEADAASRVLVGGAAAGGNLVLLTVATTFLRQEFWDQVYREADTKPMPSELPYRRMRTSLKRITQHPKAKLWVSARLAAPSSIADTHPTLRDRLSELGATAVVPPAIKESAAEALFAGSLDAWIDRCDTAWRKSTKDWWKRRHAEAQQERTRFAALSERVAVGTANVDEMVEYASGVEQFEDPEKACTAYQAVLARAPTNAAAMFALGRLKTDVGDEEGIRLLERAVVQEPDCASAAAHLAVPWLQAHGRYREAEQFEQRARQVNEEVDCALDEAADAEQIPSVFPPPLSPSEMAVARRVLEQERAVTEAYLVRRHVRSAPGRCVLVLAIDIAALTSRPSALMDRLAERLDLRYPFVIVPLYVVEGDDADSRRRFADAVRQVRGARLV